MVKLVVVVVVMKVMISFVMTSKESVCVCKVRCEG